MPIHPSVLFTENNRTYVMGCIVYIEGQDVTQYLTGSIDISMAGTEDMNSLSITLANPNDVFTITEKNACGVWREDEKIKRKLFIQKQFFNKRRGRRVSSRRDKERLYKALNASDDTLTQANRRDMFDPGGIYAATMDDTGSESRVDERSGVPPFQLSPKSLIFNIHDSIRVFVKNPFRSDSTQPGSWLPAFTGFISSVPQNKGISVSTVTLGAYCLKGLLARMRVRMNPGPATDPSGDPTGVQADLVDFAPEFNGESGIFADLRGASNYQHPLAGRNYPEAISFLLAGHIQASDYEKEQLAARDKSPAQVRSIAERNVTKLTAAVDEQERELRELENTPASDRRFSRRTKRSQVEAKQANIARLRARLSQEQRIFAEALGNQAKDGLRAIITGKATQAPPRQIGDRQKENVGNLQRGWSVSRRSTASIPGFPLEKWHNLTLFGRFGPIEDNDPEDRKRLRGKSPGWPGRPLSLAEVRDIGKQTQTFVINPYSPMNGKLYMLLPGRESSSRSLVTMEWSDFSSETIEYSDRLTLIREISAPNHMQFMVSPCGDAIIEPPLYDADPDDFGAYSSSFMLLKDTIDLSATDEVADIPTALVVTGGEQQPEAGEIVTDQFVLNTYYKAIIQCPTLAARLGANVEMVSAPHLGTQINGESLAKDAMNQLVQYGLMHYIRRIGEATSYNTSVPWRPFLGVNRPFHTAKLGRIGLVTEMSHSFSIHGDAQTTVTVAYNRTNAGDRYRYPTGDDRMPVSYVRGFTGTAALEKSGIRVSAEIARGSGEAGTPSNRDKLSFAGTRSFGSVRKAKGNNKGIKASRLLHFGTDFFVPVYHPVYAPFDGVVVRLVINGDAHRSPGQLELAQAVAPGANVGRAKGFGMLLILRGTVKGQLADFWCGHIWGTNLKFKAGGRPRNRKPGDPPVGMRGPGTVALDSNGMEIHPGSIVRKGQLLCFVGGREGGSGPHLHAELALLNPTDTQRANAESAIQGIVDRTGSDLFDRRRAKSERVMSGRDTISLQQLHAAETELGADLGSGLARLQRNNRVQVGGWRVDPLDYMTVDDLFGPRRGKRRKEHKESVPVQPKPELVSSCKSSADPNKDAYRKEKSTVDVPDMRITEHSKRGIY